MAPTTVVIVASVWVKALAVNCCPARWPVSMAAVHSRAGLRPGVWVQVVFAEGLWVAGRCSALAFTGEVEAGPEVLEGFAVVLASGDRCSGHSGEGVPGFAEPFGSGVVLVGFVDDGVADIEEHGADRGVRIRRAGVPRRGFVRRVR
ncbi:MAG: hypothetical protein ACRDUV_20355 [Pseudonocardiaceae bacterium]